MFIGFDIGGTNLRAALFDENWTTQQTLQVKQQRGATQPQEVIDQMNHCLEQFDVDPKQIKAMGIGLAAQLDKTARVVKNAPNLGWRHVEFAQMCTRFFERDVRLVNDLNALVWGEFIGGAAQNVANVLAVYVGTGVGGALICNGQLVEGGGGVAGELGHVKVQPQGRLCGCGAQGCLEAYVGGIHLEQQIAKLAQGTSWASDVIVGDVVYLGKADALAHQDERLKMFWDKAAMMLAQHVANACTLFNPELLLLGGGILDHCDYFKTVFLQTLSPMVLEAARDGLDVRFGQRADAGMLGAAHQASLLL